jgi:hypothetical protein
MATKKCKWSREDKRGKYPVFHIDNAAPGRICAVTYTSSLSEKGFGWWCYGGSRAGNSGLSKTLTAAKAAACRHSR